MERRIAAIVAADMVGFSRLVELDETEIIQRQRRHFGELIRPEIERGGGRVVKLTGDGLIAEFPSVVDAVRSAVRVQKEMAMREAGQPEDRRIRYRVGVNLGDIIVEDNDVPGDSVYIAARLEALAEPGGIVVSGEAYDHLKTKAGVGFRSLGERQLKNIATPVRVFQVVDEVRTPAARRRGIWPLVGAVAALTAALAAVGLWWMGQTDFRPADVAEMRYELTDKPSIAVLPFAQLGDATDVEVLRDGLALDLTAALSRARTFMVISSNSTTTYKDKVVSPATVAEDLGVRYFVQGGIQRSGDELRISVELVDALAGNIVWAEKYRRAAADFFEIQDEIAMGIAALLSGEYGLVAQSELKQAKRKSATDLTAYELTLMAKEIRDRFGKENNQEALRLLHEAVRLDPQFAGAHIGLAWTYFQEVINEWRTLDRDVALEKGVESARRAIALDPESANAHYVLGSLQYWGLGALDETVASFERALDLEPNNADLLALWGGFVLPELGRVDEGVATAQAAARLNPYHADWYFAGLRSASFAAGDYEASIRYYRANKYPSTAGTLGYIAALALSGRSDEARSEASDFLMNYPDFRVTLEWLRVQSFSGQVRERLRAGLLQAGLPE